MSENFSYIKASEYYTKITDGTHDSPKQQAIGRYLITSKHIKGRTIDFDTAYFISDADFKKINERSKVEQWDVIVSMIGEYCGFSYIERDAEINYAVKNVGIFKAATQIEAEWLYYYLSSPIGKQKLKQIKSGSSQPYLSLGGLRNLPILQPSNNTIKSNIVYLLSSLDSKIALNNRINAELEAMAKTVYDYWFVQFDFPFDFAQGKPSAEGKPYKSSGGKMIWSEELKREVPEGWEVSLIADWILKDKNGDWGKESLEGNYTEHVSCIRGADINGLNGKGECNPPERYILEKNSNKQLSSHDLIVEISGGSPTQSTGRLAYLIDETLNRFDNPLICSNFCKAIELKNKKQLFNFVYNWNRLYDNGVLFGYEGKTSGIKNLLFDSFVNSYWVALPPQELVNKFYDLMLDIEKKKQKALKENQQLSSLRDWLLPMLMNGQVKVGSGYEGEVESLMAAEAGVGYGG
jgi:type I restriction enzyme S subunit